MRTHLAKTSVELHLFAGDYLINGSSYIVVDTPAAASSKECKSTPMRVKDYLLCLSGVSDDQKKYAVTEPYVGDLHSRWHPVKSDFFMAPVKLEGFSRIKRQWNVYLACRFLIPAPGLDILLAAA